MKLAEYFEKEKIKYGPWSKQNGLPASIICRHMKLGAGFALNTALKITAATGGQVTLEDLLRKNGDAIQK